MAKKLVVLVLILVVLLALNTFIVDRQTRPAEARSGGQILETAVLPANVQVQGSGPDIILLHGFGAAMDWWDEVAPALATDHRVTRIDLVGHGGTAAPRAGYSMEHHAKLVLAVMDKLGIQHATIIGHSMGGEVASKLAMIQPKRVDQLVLIDTPSKPDTRFTPLAQAFFTPVIGELLSQMRTDALVRKGLAQGFAPGFPVPEKFVADFRQLTYPAARESHAKSEALRAYMPIPQQLLGIEPPPRMLVIFGSEDAIVPPSSARDFEAVPGTRVVMIPGVGHSPIVEAPEKVVEAIRGFLQ